MTATPFFAKFPLGPQAPHGVPSATCLFTFVFPISHNTFSGRFRPTAVHRRPSLYSFRSDRAPHRNLSSNPDPLNFHT